MNRYIALAILAVLSWTNASADEWDTTCFLVAEYNVTCEGVAKPAVLSAEFPPGYEGTVVDDTVYYQWTITNSVQRSSVIIHEMVHYLLMANGLVPADTPESICVSEGYAHDVSNRYVLSQDRDDLLMDRWWRARSYYKAGCRKRHSRLDHFSGSYMTP